MWHFQWCTKYRDQRFENTAVRTAVEQCIREAVQAHNITIIELNVQPEHVHCVASLPLTMAPSQALQILKGGSAFLILKRHPELREACGGHLWSSGKFAASIGNADLDRVTEYVRDQDEHHGTYGFARGKSSIVKGEFVTL